MLSGQRHPPLSVEGGSTSQWILMDFGDVVAHIFRSDIRKHYGLEKLWSDAKRVRLPEATKPTATTLEPPRKRRARNARQG